MTSTFDPNNQRVDALMRTARPPLEAMIETAEDLSALRRRWRQMEAMPVLKERRDQGADQSWAGFDIRTLLRGEESAARFATHSIRLAPGGSFPAHYHEDVHAYFLIGRGPVEMRIGAVVERLEDYEFAYAPPRTRQAFRNPSGAPVTLTVVYSPAGAERAFAAARERWLATGDKEVSNYYPLLERFGFRFDDQPLPNDEKTNFSLPQVEGDVRFEGDLERLRDEFYRRPAFPRLVRTTPEDVAAVTSVGETFRKAVLTGDDSAGEAMVHMLAGQPGMHAAPHHQPTEEEFFFVARGPFEVTCGTETRVMDEGGFAFAPRNCTHGFSNRNPDKHVRFFTLNAPAGHERVLRAFRELGDKNAPAEAYRQLRLAGRSVAHQ